MYLHAAFSCLLIGWAISSSATTSNFNNVMAQLSVTYLIAFLLMRKPIKWQLIVSFALILVSDLLYRFWPVEGFNQPFVAGHNFGSWTDMMLTGSIDHGNWVPFNAIPTSAHTIWGVVVGMLLMKDWTPTQKDYDSFDNRNHWGNRWLCNESFHSDHQTYLYKFVYNCQRRLVFNRNGYFILAY